jgi:hypothetical protein
MRFQRTAELLHFTDSCILLHKSMIESAGEKQQGCIFQRASKLCLLWKKLIFQLWYCVKMYDWFYDWLPPRIEYIPHVVLNVTLQRIFPKSQRQVTWCQFGVMVLLWYGIILLDWFIVPFNIRRYISLLLVSGKQGLNRITAFADKTDFVSVLYVQTPSQLLMLLLLQDLNLGHYCTLVWFQYGTHVWSAK